MKFDKTVALIALQSITVGCLFFFGFDHTWNTLLFIFFIIISLSLLTLRLRLLTSLKEMKITLDRALSGNLHTRLLTNQDEKFDEFIFSVNQVIEQLEKVQVEAIQSQASRRQLLSSISHDIRTPLTSIIGYIDALKDDIAASKEEQQDYLEIISRKAGSLKTLIDEMFNMAKLDADELTLNEEPLDFAEVVRESIIEFLPELAKHDIELKVDLPEERFLVYADPVSLVRIMNNLLKNAIHYGREGKRIGIQLQENEQHYQLNVWDHGPGIQQSDLAQVFERMYTTDQSRNRSNGGSGLGLAITKALVEKHGGEVWVESVPWEKTIFSFTIPKTDQLRNY